MASDSIDHTRRKHRRSTPSDGDADEPSKRRKHRRSSPSDGDADEPSKRRKHRHHHRHHRHHHHSKKHEEIDSKPEKQTDKAENETEKGLQAGEAAVSIGTTVVGVSNLGLDYDMEEGEIIEDGEIIDEGNVVIKKSKAEDDSDMEFHGAQGQEHEDGVEKVDRDSIASGQPEDDMKGRKASRISDEVGRERKFNHKHFANGSYVGEFPKLDSKPQKEDSYPGEGSNNDIESDYLDQRKSTPESAGKRHKSLSLSSSHEGRHEGGLVWNSSKSPDRSRGRSRSQSIVEESFLASKSRKKDDACEKDSRYKSNLDDERMMGYGRDYRHGSRESSRDKEKERSSGYSKHTSRDGRYYSRESIDRYRESSMDIDRDRVVEKDRERVLARERQSEKDRERNRERERERENARDRENEKARDRRRERDRVRECERERVRERDSIREREERVRRNGDRENRGRSRDKDSDRFSRQRRYDDLDEGYGKRDKYNTSRHDTDIERDRTSDHVKIEKSKLKAVEADSEKSRRDEDAQEDYQERVFFQLAEQEEDEADRIKEESRRRRQAILEKHKNRQSQTGQVTQSGDIAKVHVEQSTQKPVAGDIVVPVAIDGRTDGAVVYVDEPTLSLGKSPMQGGHIADEQASVAGGLGQGTPKSERSADMFSDDIFGESPAGIRKMGKGDDLAIERSGLHDNWDDPEGYYSYRFGEILDGHYEIIAAHGKGVFSTVVRAKDLKARPGDLEEVAIKIIRNNETMYKAGMEELVILNKLVGSDPEDKRHCVRFISNFKYRNHLCLVFESLNMNLREVLKKFGRNIGLKLTAVRAYAKQLFIALKHLRNCGVLHCDIKPDNMLVNEAKNVLKLCDFGNAMFAGKNEITPYLVSRFYRAPEIILGLPYDHPMDMWSVGCCLFELYAGKVLFPGHTNNDMLRLHMELKGPFPKKMLRKGAFTDQHFDQDLNFLAIEEDPVTKKALRKLIINIKPKDISTVISGSPGEDPKMFAHFKDLLERIFVLDPDKRITVSQALSHPFITGK